MFEKVKEFFTKRRIERKLKRIKSELEKASYNSLKMWDEREWDACIRIYCSNNELSYAAAVHQAHELVKEFKKKEYEVDESK